MGFYMYLPDNKLLSSPCLKALLVQARVSSHDMTDKIFTQLCSRDCWHGRHTSQLPVFMMHSFRARCEQTL